MFEKKHKCISVSSFGSLGWLHGLEVLDVLLASVNCANGGIAQEASNLLCCRKPYYKQEPKKLHLQAQKSRPDILHPLNRSCPRRRPCRKKTVATLLGVTDVAERARSKLQRP